ncbi:MAG: hypothetical protein II838_01535 [Lachnospiraceae bacterium]|nr:hypothetical protein [Lachnospiraceae bacterium]
MEYTYDSANRLTAVLSLEGEVIRSFVYDLAGRLIKEVDANGIKSNTTAGNFVSTSSDKAIATEFAGKNGYVYELQTDNYVDINSTYGAGAYFPEQMEFSIPGGIKSSEIVGAYKKQGGEIVGDFIPNPNFGGN